MSKLLLFLKRHALRITVSVAILSFFVLYSQHLIEVELIAAIENKLYDARLRSTLPTAQNDPRIVIVDIDENSLKEVGRWPWNRAVMAQLLDRLFDTYQIEVLGMDMVFAEPDDSSGLKQLEALASGPLQQTPGFSQILDQLRPVLDYDSLFAKSMQNHKVVLGYIFTGTGTATTTTDTAETTEVNSSSSVTRSGQLPPPVLSPADTQSYDLSTALVGAGYTANLPLFQTNATTAGHFNPDLDSDGIIRRVPMLYYHQGALYESLSLAVTRVALGIEKIVLESEWEHGRQHLVSLLVGDDKRMTIDERLRAWVPYRGTSHSFTYLSARDVLHQRISDPNVLKGKIVLLGTSAQGLVDLRATPVQEVFPGVEIHANLIAGILSNSLKSQLANQSQIETALLIGIGIIMITLLPLFSPLIATLGTLFLSVAAIMLNIMFWNAQIVFPLATTLSLVVALFIFNMSYGYFVETRSKRQLTHLFGQYVPPELVDEMSQHLGQEFTTAAESREMTVLFSDVRGFTTISEGLEPQELSDLMNQYLTPMTRIIHEFRGTIDKYMGDAIMAFWGAPLPDPQHAQHAVAAAMQMLVQLKELQPQFKANGWPEIKIGVGLNTGLMSVGNMGSEFRMAYTVLGDAVNLGSRLEGITKQYGVQFIVSETTKAAAPEYIYRELDRVKVKGKDQPVAIFEPVGLRDQVSRNDFEEIVEYEKALEHYRHQHWKEALQQFSLLHQQRPERLLYKIYHERVEYFMKNPPGEDWDGVYTFTSK